jgi:hypothetical protein
VDCSVAVIKGLDEPGDDIQMNRSFRRGDIIMRTICMISYVILAIVFAAVSLFLPYAILVLAAAVVLGFPCKIFRRSNAKECRLGFC